MNQKRFPKFLRTFDQTAGGAPNGQLTGNLQVPPQGQNAPQQMQQGAMIPVEALGAIIDLASQRDRIRQQHQQVVQQTDQQLAPPPPRVPTPPPPAEDDVKELRRELRAATKRADDAALATYRLQAIQAYRGAGYELIDSLVGGRTTAEIDSSCQVAATEYQTIQQNVMRQMQAQQTQQAPALPNQQVPTPPQNPNQPQGQAQQQPTQAQAPQGFVQQLPPPTAQSLGLPGFVAAPGLPPQQQGGIDLNAIRQATSAGSVRNGNYAQNRHALMGALAQGTQGPGSDGWSFNAGMSLAPAMPVAARPAPAMQPNAYAGVQMPVVRPQTGILQQQGFPTPAQQHQQMMMSQHPTHPGYNLSPVNYQAPQQQAFAPQSAPQPVDLDAGRQLDGGAIGAAQNAAQAAINQRRAIASNMAPTH